MRIDKPKGVLLEWLVKAGLGEYINCGFDVDDGEFARYMAECRRAHGGYTEEESEAWSVFNCLQHPRTGKVVPVGEADPSGAVTVIAKTIHAIHSPVEATVKVPPIEILPIEIPTIPILKVDPVELLVRELPPELQVFHNFVFSQQMVRAGIVYAVLFLAALVFLCIKAVD